MRLLTTTFLLGLIVQMSTAFDAAEPPSTDEEPAIALSSGFETPEKCFYAVLKAQDGDDVATVLPGYSEALLNHTLGSIALKLEQYAHISDLGDEPKACRVVLEEYGLNDADLTGFLQVVDSPIPGGATAGLVQIGDTIEDKISFMREGSQAIVVVNEKIEKLQDEQTSNEREADDADKPDQRPTPKLADVVIEGDRAKAMVHVGDAAPVEVYFQKSKTGGWVIVMGETEPDWRKPIRGRFLFREYLEAVREHQKKEQADDNPATEAP